MNLVGLGFVCFVPHITNVSISAAATSADSKKLLP